ncbi:PLDc N-terminal domain-containing protein [Candidatus Uhrbacteria bacterium]|nr:PLDc N-terminal domain-containing protein [Candidatus Uhrbacteria bacterium]
MALAATCKINGQEVPCESLGKVAKSAVGYGFGLFALFFILMIAGTIFWILMIIHAASKPIENRPMWVVIIVLTGLLGAIIYYFVVKRNFKEETTSAVLPPTQPPVQPPTQQVS